MWLWWRWLLWNRYQDQLLLKMWMFIWCVLVLCKINMNPQLLILKKKYRTRAIITRSWFETALDYKPRILGPTFLVYVLKWSVILTSLALKNVINSKYCQMALRLVLILPTVLLGWYLIEPPGQSVTENAPHFHIPCCFGSCLFPSLKLR